MIFSGRLGSCIHNTNTSHKRPTIVSYELCISNRLHKMVVKMQPAANIILANLIDLPNNQMTTKLSGYDAASHGIHPIPTQHRLACIS